MKERKKNRRLLVDKPDFPKFDDMICYNPNLLKRPKYAVPSLVDDLQVLFAYLPRTELNRMVTSFIWCITEALRTYGHVELSSLGAFKVRARDEIKAKSRYIVKQIGTLGTVTDLFYEVSKVDSCVRPVCTFDPSVWVKCLLSSPDIRNFLVYISPHRKVVTYARALLVLFRHYKRGLVLRQNAFAKDMAYLGYTDEYLDYMDKDEQADTTEATFAVPATEGVKVRYLASDLFDGKVPQTEIDKVRIEELKFKQSGTSYFRPSERQELADLLVKYPEYKK